MRFSKISLLAVSTLIGSSFALPQALRDALAARGVPAFNRSAMVNKPRWIVRRGEPNTDASFPEEGAPPPLAIDKVETAIFDAIGLTSYVVGFFDDGTFANYFDAVDATEIRRIFTVLNNNDMGADFLNNVLITQTDTANLCGNGRTLAYTQDAEGANPQITLCPRAFNKKAVTALNGASNSDPNLKQLCSEDGGQIAQHVSWVFNTLGMTLLHEYMHIDQMIGASWGSIVDDPQGSPGYGPVNVYNRIPKNLARINADSYAYFASETMWSVLCGRQFQPPRAGIDDQDPDCAGVCEA